MICAIAAKCMFESAWVYVYRLKNGMHILVSARNVRSRWCTKPNGGWFRHRDQVFDCTPYVRNGPVWFWGIDSIIKIERETDREWETKEVNVGVSVCVWEKLAANVSDTEEHGDIVGVTEEVKHDEDGTKVQMDVDGEQCKVVLRTIHLRISRRVGSLRSCQGLLSSFATRSWAWISTLVNISHSGCSISMCEYFKIVIGPQWAVDSDRKKWFLFVLIKMTTTCKRLRENNNQLVSSEQKNGQYHKQM